MVVAWNTMAFAQHDLSKLIEKAAREGYVRVIVGLKLPDPGFKPEGSLGNQEAIMRQRENIVAIREELLKTLSGCDIEVYAIWPSIPSVALKVDPCALKRLAYSPYVTIIQEDSQDKPHKTGANSEMGKCLRLEDKNSN
jgi:hypothetical protein